jgi:hypothetical protein
MAQKYLFIAISFYLLIVILCAKMSRVNKAYDIICCFEKNLKGNSDNT